MKRIVLSLIFLLIAGCGAKDTPTLVPTLGFPPTVTTVATTATTVPTWTPTPTRTPAPTRTSVPTATPFPDRPTGKVELSGYGSSVETVTLPDPLSSVFFGHRGSGNFIVWAYFSSNTEELLVNGIGVYLGERPLISSDPVILEIEADGEWEAIIEPLELVEYRESGTIPPDGIGVGDSVSGLFFPPERGQWNYTYDGDGNFIVWVICAGGSELVANEIGITRGSAVVSFPEGPCLWDIAAELDPLTLQGTWTLEPGD